MGRGNLLGFLKSTCAGLLDRGQVKGLSYAELLPSPPTCYMSGAQYMRIFRDTTPRELLIGLCSHFFIFLSCCSIAFILKSCVRSLAGFQSLYDSRK